MVARIVVLGIPSQVPDQGIVRSQDATVVYIRGAYVDLLTLPLPFCSVLNQKYLASQNS